MNKLQTDKFIKLYNQGFSASYIVNALEIKLHTSVTYDVNGKLNALALMWVNRKAANLGLGNRRKRNNGGRFWGIDTQLKQLKLQIEAKKNKISKEKQVILRFEKRKEDAKNTLLFLENNLEVLIEKQIEIENKIASNGSN